MEGQVTLPPKTGYRHPSGHSHHYARPLYAPPIPVRSDEQFERELAERMTRINGTRHELECGCGECGRTRRGSKL